MQIHVSLSMFSTEKFRNSYNVIKTNYIQRIFIKDSNSTSITNFSIFNLRQNVT
jgi:hypothetical protein